MSDVTDSVFTHPNLSLSAPPAHGGTSAPSALDVLRDELATVLAEDTVTVKVPKRPGWTATCSADIQYEEYAHWRAAAIDPQIGLNELRMSLTTLIAKCQSIEKDGEPAGAGGALTFLSGDLQRMLGAADAEQAARRFFVRDADVIRAAQRVLRAAGYTGQSDPT